MSSKKEKPLKSALKKKGNENNEKKKKKKNSVSFGQVDIFHFNRAQGFAAVPSSGGYSLGMKKKHFLEESLTVDEHNHDKNIKRLIEERRRAREDSQMSALNVDISDIRLITEEERVNMLLHAGVKLDHSEKLECEYIQTSRMKNGCECTDICLKNTCSCWRSGINCQVDRFSYPCGCSMRGCKNPYGRTNYKTDKIQDHFIRTLSRLSLRDNNAQEDIHHNSNDEYDNDDSKRMYSARVRR